MLKFNWDGFTAENYDEYFREEHIDDCDYIGSVRIGDLCFEIVAWHFGRDGDRLGFEIYVGGVDDGYGYSKSGSCLCQDETDKGYPYTQMDGDVFSFDERNGMSYEEFRTAAEEEFTQYIEWYDLTEKAEMPLHIW